MNGIARKRDCTQSQPEFQIKWYFIHTAYLIPVQRSHYIFSIKCSFPNAFHNGSKNCGIGKKKKKSLVFAQSTFSGCINAFSLKYVLLLLQ